MILKIEFDLVVIFEVENERLYLTFDTTNSHGVDLYFIVIGIGEEVNK